MLRILCGFPAFGAAYLIISQAKTVGLLPADGHPVPSSAGPAAGTCLAGTFLRSWTSDYSVTVPTQQTLENQQLAFEADLVGEGTQKEQA